MRSRIDVRVRNSTSARDTRSRNSRTQVVTHEPVVSGERRSDLRVGAARLHRQGGEVQADRPALGPLDELIHVRFGELDSGRRQQRAGLVAAHRQIIDPDLHDAALRTQPRRRKRQRVPRADRHLRASRQSERQRGDRVETLPVRHRFEMIEDERDRLLASRP